eukprot:3097855-Lingulodinium_polyedra.AAC.1
MAVVGQCRTNIDAVQAKDDSIKRPSNPCHYTCTAALPPCLSRQLAPDGAVHLILTRAGRAIRGKIWLKCTALGLQWPWRTCSLRLTKTNPILSSWA